MNAIGIIPARLQSSRLPQKLLLNLTGKPLIQYTWESAKQSRALAEVIIATDSAEIADTVRSFGGRCEMTGDHSCGTDRIAEVVARCCPDADLVVNIQGDEPEIDPDHIDQLVNELATHSSSQMATLATSITDRTILDDPSCTKVVCSNDGRALYFSRCPIPYCRDQDPAERLASNSPWRLHIGIYAYRRDFLLKLSSMPASRLERLEKLEQLRALEAGATIRVAVVNKSAVGIDTPDDYARFVERVRGRAA